MIEKKQYDVVVIGSGPGGEGAAIRLAKAGKSVAIVERHVSVGGGCTHWGTIPSKALIQVVQRYSGMKENPLFQHCIRQVKITYADLMAHVNGIVTEQVEEQQGYYDRNNIDVIEGHAAFLDPMRVEVRRDEIPVLHLTASAFVIASGSHPYRPPDVDFSSSRIVDSDTILKLDHIPTSMTIYGAGVVGCEYASAFRALSVKINLVSTRGRLLEFLDDEISDALSYHLRDHGTLIRHNEQYQSVEEVEDGVIVHMTTGKKLKSDVLLWANGRTGNSASLGLESLGIEPDHRGNLKVNGNFQTAYPHIYAVGDIVGYPSLASAAFDQGRRVGNAILSGTSSEPFLKLIPTGIYTTPEISTIGKTERELTAEKVPYEVGHSFFKHIARAQITGHTVGMLKILFHRETLEILGIHCFGNQAAEILHIGQAIMSQEGGANTIKYFVNNTFNYPTMAEAYRVAALNGLNRIF